MRNDQTITNKEVFFEENEIIVSKTDLKGRLTYCNEVFLAISDYSEQECLGQPHSLIRHPDMPRCIFKLLWDTLLSGNEVFAYVVNRCKTGDHYWVFAHVTPSEDKNGQIIGYHSNRRVPERAILDNAIIPLYRALLQEEAKSRNTKEGLLASFQMLEKHLNSLGMGYDEWVLTLGIKVLEKAA